jgi:hypothetical protein
MPNRYSDGLRLDTCSSNWVGATNRVYFAASRPVEALPAPYTIYILYIVYPGLKRWDVSLTTNLHLAPRSWRGAKLIGYKDNFTFLPLPRNSATAFSMHSQFPVQAELSSVAGVSGDIFSLWSHTLSLSLYLLKNFLTGNGAAKFPRPPYSPGFSPVSIWLFPEVKDSRQGFQYQCRSRTALEGEIYELGENTAIKCP